MFTHLTETLLPPHSPDLIQYLRKRLVLAQTE